MTTQICREEKQRFVDPPTTATVTRFMKNETSELPK